MKNFMYYLVYYYKKVLHIGFRLRNRLYAHAYKIIKRFKMKSHKDIAQQKQLQFLKKFKNKFFFCPKCKIVFNKKQYTRSSANQNFFICGECGVKFNKDTYKKYANNKIKIHLNGNNDTNLVENYFTPLITEFKKNKVANTKIYKSTKIPFHMIENILKNVKQ